MSAGEVMSCGDVLLWERHTTKIPRGDGSLECRLVEGVMPDGKPCVAAFQAGYKPRVAIEQWYNFVKGEYDAREAKQEAEAAQRKEASGAGGNRTDPASRVYGGSEIPTPQAIQDRQASVEALLESKIADISRSFSRVEDQIAATVAALKVLETDRDALKRERIKVVAAMRALKEDGHVD